MGKVNQGLIEELVITDLGESALHRGGWGLRESVEALDGSELSTDIPSFMSCFGQLVRNTKTLLEQLYGVDFKELLRLADAGKLPSLKVEIQKS